MRFQDIKTFPLCPYRCDVPWLWLEQHIENANRERDDFLDLNPDFQRAHVWTAEQQISYVEYILRGGTSGKELYFNCPRYSKGSIEGPYVIVDGKQRLEAVRAFMRGDIPAFGYLREEYSDGPDILTARFSWNIAGLKTRAEVLDAWTETGEFAPDKSRLVIYVRMKFEEWLKSSWTITAPAASQKRIEALTAATQMVVDWYEGRTQEVKP